MMTPAPDRSSLAAEYVLGLLDAAAEAEAARLLQTDAAFAREVEGWRERMAGFDESAELSPPSETLWSRIEQDVARPAMPARRSPRWLDRIWNSLPAWRAIGLAAAAATLLFAVAFGFALREAQRTPTMIAVLVDGDRAGAVVHIFADGRAVLMPLTAIPVPADRALEVWTLPSKERGPVSVGLMHAARTLPLLLRDLPRPGPDQLFEITLEPRTGSPTGRPTGPILYKGLTAPTL
jgi:anti-sigma-K factor RskA